MFTHILVPVDGSSLAECAVTRGIALARAFDAKITLLRVLEEQSSHSFHPIDPLEWNMWKAEVRSYLEALVKDSQQQGVRAAHALLEGHPPARILEFIQSGNVDLTILSSHGRSGLNGWNAGSVISKIILRSRVSTMIVRAYLPAGNDATAYQRMLIPLDCSQRAECALASAVVLAKKYDSQIILVHVVHRPEMPCRIPPTPEDAELANQVVERNQREARKYFERLQPRLPPSAQIRLVVADNIPLRLHELIMEEKIDLLILSAHGYSGTTKWPYGSVTSGFILYGTIPVLVVQDLSASEFELSAAEISIKQSKGH